MENIDQFQSEDKPGQTLKEYIENTNRPQNQKTLHVFADTSVTKSLCPYHYVPGFRESSDVYKLQKLKYTTYVL